MRVPFLKMFMNRFNSFDSMMGDSGPKVITLASELVQQKVYKLEGNGPYVYLGLAEGDHVFVPNDGSEPRSVSRAELDKMIASNQVVEIAGTSEYQPTVPEYPHLDKLSVNMFITPTDQLWDRTGMIGEFTRTELLQLNDLIGEKGLEDVPTPGDREYMSLIIDPRWPLLKRYIQYISPDTELPEDFA